MDKPTIVFASHNTNKLMELKQSLGKTIHLLSLKDIDFHHRIAETASTLEGNALLKAQRVFISCPFPTISDDTGLFVKALHGIPGVHSARYAGENATAQENNLKLLNAMQQIDNRQAMFRTVFCLFYQDNHHFIRGEVKGMITHQMQGQKGFGYDPIFIPNGHQQTFGQMSFEDKNRWSHRAKAIMKLRAYFSKNKFC
ncbi:MAG: RdgB/HAM1 family non-canonical purine NTP pyrophosphatase [Flavobacteriaceae bacterium]|nr:RdgB/HAM1 family non-canonical purine NTP pyrophosphatase [Flavobacteriaceae bacterium]MCY4268490.1 RdgB/HAM1 family non-canonical purine NTP pyrophosphatase [Flavobacteriaceae bacterium]